MDTRYIVIADDFTGSNDTGIQFLKAGYDASVLLDPSALSSVRDEKVVVLDTESRNMSASEAEVVLRDVAARLGPMRGKRIFYKKIDSTLRGNISTETAVLREILEFPVTAFAPAYPRNGRTVLDDLLLLDGVPVSETEMGRDPRKPVTTSSLTETLRGERNAAICHIGLSDIRGGKIPEILRSAGGKAICTFDTETDDDLRAIVDGLRSVIPVEDTLWVGSAGMAEALVTSSNPFLFVMGSVSPKSAQQAGRLLQEKDVEPLLVQIESLVTDGSSEERRLTERAIGLLRRGKTVLLSSSLEEDQIQAGRRVNASEIICKSLASVVSGVMGSVPVGGLFVTGGEIAIWIVRALEAGGTDLVEEIQPGVPLVRLRGGKFHGLPMVTKAGAFGNETTMVECLRTFQSARR